MRLVGVISILSILGASTALAEAPTGKWAMTNGKVTVSVAECGANKLCARIVGLKEPRYKDGKKKIDRFNKNEALRNRPLMGLSLLRNMKASGKNKWTGEIYNPDDGNTYSATLMLNGNRIRLQGCVMGVLCKNQTFVRVN
jgi:uncharacterized protein (DUF2147 family)